MRRSVGCFAQDASLTAGSEGVSGASKDQWRSSANVICEMAIAHQTMMLEHNNLIRFHSFSKAASRVVQVKIRIAFPAYSS